MDLDEKERSNREIPDSRNRDGAKHGEDGQEETVQEAAPAMSGLLGRLSFPRMARKRVWTISLVLLVALATALGIAQGWHRMNREVQGVPEKGAAVSPGDNLYEERLSSFVVPLPPERPTQAVVVDFSVIWDGVTSFRFKKMELKIRNRLYEFMLDFAKRKDLKEEASLLETEMGRIFKESLGTKKLAIKIGEIKAL